MTATKEKIDENTAAFEKTLENFEPTMFGRFTKSERETLRQFFDLNIESQELGRRADEIKNEVEHIETQIADARKKYAALIAEGRTREAMAAVEKIPAMRERQDDLKNKLPSITSRLDELESEVGNIDHCEYLERAKEAATAAEQARCRATTIFGRPGDVRRSINEAREKLK